MTIKVKLLASLADRFGQREVGIDHTTGMTVRDAWDRATCGAPLLAHTLTALNLEYCAMNAALNDGDEVAFFPPVTGG